MQDQVLVALGRYGDIINALPIAWDMAQKSGHKTKFAAASQFWDILECASYVQPLAWNVDYARLGYALQQFARTNPGAKAIAAQCYGHHADHKRLTDSYQKESWRIAGYLDRFGSIPLVIDNRDSGREIELCAKALNPALNRVCLVGAVGISSPFQKGSELLGMLRNALPGVDVVDLDKVRSGRVYDLIGLYDRADLLVSVDTIHLHLARASKVPVISIINDGWFGSVPPATNIRTFRYGGLNLNDVVAEAKKHFDEK